MAAIARRTVTATTSRGQPVRVSIPTGAVARRAGTAVRRGSTAAARAAWSERHTLTAVMSAGVLGLAARQGVALPHIGALGIPGTYGLAAWGLGKVTKSRMLSHVATGLLCVGTFQLAAGMTPGSAPARGGGNVRLPDEDDVEEGEEG